MDLKNGRKIKLFIYTNLIYDNNSFLCEPIHNKKSGDEMGLTR